MGRSSLTTKDLRGRRLLIVGNPDSTHVGGFFKRAADTIGLETAFLDMRSAGSRLHFVNRINSLVRPNNPIQMASFNRDLIRLAGDFKPQWVLLAGAIAVTRATLESLGQLGTKRLIYLTDDPFSPKRRAQWFHEALPSYDRVFTPRRANISELEEHGSCHVEYLRFGYSPDVHFRELDCDSSQFDTDVAFVGGADADRVPFVSALVRAGFRVGLYGPYWDRFSATRAYARGMAGAGALRRAISGSKIALCLVRRSNRDGHCMRTFEAPAIGACMLTEDTQEHRAIFGEDGQSVAYFTTVDEMLFRAKFLLQNSVERERLALAAHRLIREGQNTYSDRLVRMLQEC